MVLKSDCKLPKIWVPGTITPFSKGYCTTQASPPDYNTLSNKCVKPRVWIPGTKSPLTKGFCATSTPKSKSPTPKAKSPTPNVKTPTPNAKTPPKSKCNVNNVKYLKSPDRYICNPSTGNWVIKNGEIGIKILKGGFKATTTPKAKSPTPNAKTQPKSKCNVNNVKYLKSPDKYICNPSTGNWVIKNGEIGIKILKGFKHTNPTNTKCKSTV